MTEYTEFLSPIEDVIDDARNGKMFILVDDEERENEGDLVIPAQMATPESINFMAKYGRGLICLPLSKTRVDELQIPLMAQNNESRHRTAFTTSIEAREGISTGISAHDRAHTISVAIDPTKQVNDLVSPGHVFPLVARDGGVLVRAGHTEAAVDIAKLAGLNPSGVICEIMKDDGTMARMPDLIEFAKEHSLKIATIADLISYRIKYDKLVKKEVETTLTSQYGGEFKAAIYVNNVEHAEHVVLIKGDIDTSKPVMVRMHAFNVLYDALGDKFAGKDGDLQKSMKMIEENGSGVVVLIREANKRAVSNILKERQGEDVSKKVTLRDYGIGAQILLDLGVKDIVLLSNSEHSVIGLDGYGLKIVEHKAIR